MATVVMLAALLASDRASAQVITPVMRQEPRSALVIGNSSYANQPLQNPGNDAPLMARTLENLGFQVTLLLDADQATMKRSIDDFAHSLHRGGVALFYFAGHGVQVDGRNYMIPLKANIQREGDVDIESVPVARVLTKLEGAATRINLVILDACRNNPFAGRFRTMSRGLEFVQAPQGTMIAYSTSPGGVAADGTTGADNSPFTEALVYEMTRAPATVEQLLKRVRTRVKEQTNGQQISRDLSSLEGDFYFKLPKDSHDTPPVCAPGEVLEAGDCVAEPTRPAGPAKPTSTRPASDQEPEVKARDMEMRTVHPTSRSTVPSAEDHLEPSDGNAGARTAAYVSFALGAAGVGLALAMNHAAKEPQKRLDAACNDEGKCPPSAQNDLDDFELYQTLNIVGWAVAVLGPVFGLALLPAKDVGSSAQLKPYWAGSSGGVSGRF